jgi:hypothetical protein
MSHYQGSVPETPRKPDWRDTALCRKEDPELFFPKGYEGPWQLVIEQAKAVCRRCPSADACLQYALTASIPSGIFGGLTEQERASLRRVTNRRKLAPEAAAEKAAQARQPKPKPTTLRSLFDDNTVRLHGGHLGWTGPARPCFKGQDYTPKQLAFIVDRGYYPQGRVLVDCGISECVLPLHIADDEERIRCGTRAGYRRHRERGEEACRPCKDANTGADNRLRRTGTTKAAA